MSERWAKIHPESWAVRLRNGDVSVWREMLIGRFEGAVQDAQMFGVLGSEDAWRKSDFAYLSVSRRGLLTEAWFYEAMRAKAEGDEPRMREDLRRCVEIGYSSYLEHDIATYLLSERR